MERRMGKMELQLVRELVQVLVLVLLWPLMVPMLMLLGISPEMATAA